MEEEIKLLKQTLQCRDNEIADLKRKLEVLENHSHSSLPGTYNSSTTAPEFIPSDELTNADISRYSRQLILPEIGPKGQLALAHTSVLIVGAGGLGCPAAIYLAAAGIGCIGIVDYDDVELSNLHRQILHTEQRNQQSKSASIAASCSSLNSGVKCIPYHLALNSTNALDIIKKYDIVLDATDNLPTRYLLNDACVLCAKPLISGSALRFEGQLTIYNHLGGPCYRCLFPSPPPPGSVTNCSDGGVLGVVPGIIGCLQAMEAIKMVVGIPTNLNKAMLLLDASDTNSLFRSFKLRTKNDKCKMCGLNPEITQLVDYELFCSSKATDKTKHVSILDESQRLSVKDYRHILDSGVDHVLVDVRQPVELDICKLPAACCINIPISEIKLPKHVDALLKHTQENRPVYVVCRQGNDSQRAVEALSELLPSTIQTKDIAGGLTAWAQHIDQNFPVY